jgi:hypothetical protein
VSTAGLVPVFDDLGGSDHRLAQWVELVAGLGQASAALARTPFVPASLRVEDNGRYDEGATAANVTAAVLTGDELGLAPMASLRSINLIQSTPALSALALRALALRAGHGIWLREATKTRAVVDGLRSGDDEANMQRITWSIDDARDRNLAGKPNWRTQPRNMLIARATSEVVRLVAADAILGIPYSVEELMDGDLALVGEEANGSAGALEPKKRRTAQRRPPAALAPAAEDEPPPDPPAEPPAPEPISAEQMRALQAGFRMLDIKARGPRLAVVHQVVQRPEGAAPIETSHDLTAAEASMVLDHLSVLKARQDQAASNEVEEPEASAPAATEDEPDPSE